MYLNGQEISLRVSDNSDQLLQPLVEPDYNSFVLEDGIGGFLYPVTSIGKIKELAWNAECLMSAKVVQFETFG